MRQDAREELGWWAQLAGDDPVERARGINKVRPQKPKRTEVTIRSELVEELYQPEADYNFTYKASRHEQQWLSAALASFYDDSLISDVLHLVRGGKEANVYCCQAHPTLGMGLLAAKVYRPSLLRNLKNDAMYKEGRALLGDDGKALRDHRSQRAVRKKTRVGTELSITSWIEYEFQVLRRLHAAGADVPRPVAQSGTTILMEYIGEVASPAPTLSGVALARDEIQPLFERLMGNVRLMLENNLVHADLSAYNVLYWEGQVKIIDFPQVVDPIGNRNGFDLLQRDVQRVCQYFERQGLRTNPRALAGEMWNYFEGRRM